MSNGRHEIGRGWGWDGRPAARVAAGLLPVLAAVAAVLGLPAVPELLQPASTGPVRSVGVADAAPAPAPKAGPKVVEDAGDLTTASLKLQRGDHAAAEPLYRKLADAAPTKAAGLAGLAEIMLATGRHEECAKLLEPEAGRPDADAVVLVKWGELLSTTGRVNEALIAFRRARDAAPENVDARRALGELLIQVGKRDEGVEELRWFERFSKKGVDPRTPAEMVTAGDALDRLAVETGRRSFYSKFILNELYVKAEQADKNCWQSRLSQGRILASRYNRAQAVKELKAALAINPKVADAHVLMADILLEQWNFEGVESAVTEALKINPRHVDALAMRAALKIQERRHAEGFAAAEEALKINPVHPTALGLAAAAARMVPDEERYKEMLARAKQSSTAPAQAWLVAADKLAGDRQFQDALELIAQALQWAPSNSDALSVRGMVLMQTGDEAGAREALETAYRMDSYNAKVFNTLGLLDKLAKWGKDDVVTEHFVVRYSKADDPLLGRLFSEFCESIHGELTELFGHKPPVKTLIEILPDHQQFGVRLTGLPMIHTVGACTGDVIAMDSPDPRRLPSGFPTFNWAQVLKHEYTHTITLSATGNRIAHWYTEGLAVWSERRQRSWRWQLMLVQQLANDDLFKPQEISWGFIRPRRRDRDDRQLAYAQAEWICHFVEGRWGRKALLDLMAGFRDRRKQDAVLKEVTGLDEDAFHKAFLEFARADVAKWGFRLPAPSRKVDDVQADLKGKPDDPALLMELARAQVKAKAMPAALETAKKALAKAPDNPEAMRLAASLLAGSRVPKDREEADRLRVRCYELDPKDWQAAEAVGRAARAKNDVPKALEAFERVVSVVPGHLPVRQELAKLYELTEKFDKVYETRKHLIAQDEGNREHAAWLADFCSEQGRHAEAVGWFRQVLHVDPYDVNAHFSIGDSARKTDWAADKKSATALAAYENALIVRKMQNDDLRKRGGRPDLSREAYAWMKIAALHKEHGRIEPAREAAKSALELDADSGAKQFLEELK